MATILDYDNRNKLYDFLIRDFNFSKIEEKFEPEKFGNFYILLKSDFFSLQYIKDRSILSIEIARSANPIDWYDLSFIQDLIYAPSMMNEKEELNNEIRIAKLNDFLKADFSKISQLFSDKFYSSTKKKLDTILKNKFYNRFGGPEDWKIEQKI